MKTEECYMCTWKIAVGKAGLFTSLPRPKNADGG